MVETNFKQTDIGLVPEDWEIKTIEEVAKVFGGGTPSTRDSIYWNGDINWFTPTEVGKSKYLYDSVRKITEEGLSNCSARILPINTILITTRAGIGDLGILKIPSATNQGFQSLIPNENIDYEFLYYLVSTLKPLLLKNASGSTFLEISPSKVKSIEIPVPPLPEQKAIAEVLSDTDHWITSLEDLIAKKQLIKQGAMQKLLTPKEDWEVNKLGEVGKTYGGLSGKTKVDFGRGNAHYIPFMNVMKNVIIDNSFFEKVNLKQGEIQNKILKNDLLFNGSSETPEELGISSVILEDIENLYLNSFCFGFRLFENNVNPLFLSYLFRSPYGRKIIFYLAQGATRYNLSKANFLELEISLPKSVVQQNYIATILSDMDAEIGALEQKLIKAKQIKQGLMQKLLTGRIRLV
ncbi:restriction endonuclease subunit S [Myroides odoratimimus]|uniref:restriction endonuclease subunit S n=1 Tax=Myroides odoratimimus TaxID=76832 RepID=UPI0038D4D5EA